MSTRKISTLAICLISILFVVSFASATQNYAYTADQHCFDSKDVFLEGEDIYLKINIISGGVHYWSAKGLGSCNNQTISYGYFGIPPNYPNSVCFKMDIPQANCGEYEISIIDDVYGNLTTRYSVVNPPIVPEFGLLFGILTITMAITAFFFIRRN